MDITFGDYLRALVTADYELVPNDELGERGAMIEAFRMRGMYPANVASLAEESLLWENADPALAKLPTEGLEMLRELFFAAADFGRTSAPWVSWGAQSSSPTQPRRSSFEAADGGPDLELSSDMAKALWAYADQNRQLLHLHPVHKIEAHGFHPVFRVAPNGQLLIELVAQFAQTDRSRTEDFGGILLRGGTTLIASADGTVRYVISKPLPSPTLNPSPCQAASRRLVERCTSSRPRFPDLS